jgi:hypothetical protein
MSSGGQLGKRAHQKGYKLLWGPLTAFQRRRKGLLDHDAPGVRWGHCSFYPALRPLPRDAQREQQGVIVCCEE